MSKPYFDLESAAWPAGSLTFRELQGRLLMYVVRRIRNGEFTERGLARILGVSQPQLHNVLKGARPLKPEFADCLLQHFKIGVLDLVGARELSLQTASYEEAASSWWPDVPDHTRKHLMPKINDARKSPRWQPSELESGHREVG